MWNLYIEFQLQSYSYLAEYHTAYLDESLTYVFFGFRVLSHPDVSANDTVKSCPHGIRTADIILLLFLLRIQQKFLLSVQAVLPVLPFCFQHVFSE